MKTKEEIIRIFGDSGLLVRTVQLKDLDKNFNDIEDDVTTAVEKAKTLSEMGDIKVVKLRGCSVIYNHTTKITKSGANLIEIYRYNLNNNFFSSSTI